LFQFHFGSIQTLRGFRKLKTSLRVSIPLWFDSNRRRPLPGAQSPWFQFHFGSIQTADVKQRGTISIMFQFHFGSIQTDYLFSSTNRTPMFQFHFGSIQTHPCAHGAGKIPVSIPLWFDSN